MIIGLLFAILGSKGYLGYPTVEKTVFCSCISMLEGILEGLLVAHVLGF